MKEYFVIFILFTIFILYSVTLVSKDLNRMRCIEGFEAPYTFKQLFSSDTNRGDLCSTADQHIDFSTDGSSTYQLTCHDECSSTNTDVPVTEGRSNCMIPSDSNTSNCEVTVSTKCYLDGDFHEISSNVNMYCPDSGYAECAECVIPSPRSGCSNVDGSCQRTDLVTLPTGYARCILNHYVYGVNYLTSDSNFVIPCNPSDCPASTSSSPTGTTLTKITSGSCSNSLECYGDAEYVDGNSFKIDGKVLGIKIPSTSIYIDTDGITKAKVQITLNNWINHNSWQNMVIGLCEGIDELNERITEDMVTKLKGFYLGYTPPYSYTYDNTKHESSSIGKSQHNEKAVEVFFIDGKKYNPHYNIVHGDHFHSYHQSDHIGDTKSGRDEDLKNFVNRNTNEITLYFNSNMKMNLADNNHTVPIVTLNPDGHFDPNNTYFYIKGVENYKSYDIPEGRQIKVTFQPSHQNKYEYTTIDQDYNISRDSWSFTNTLQYCIDHCNYQPSCVGFTRDITKNSDDVDGRCWFHNHIYDYGGDDDGKRRLYTKGAIK